MSEKAAVEVTGIWLRTIGDRVQVLAEVSGQWRVVNDERLLDGARTVISHITEPSGVLSAPLDSILSESKP